jgi:hypothetical protein
MNDKTKDPTGDSSATSAADAIEARVVALAEQFGRLVGTVQARADGLVDRQALNEQLTRIRDGATGLLGHLAGLKPSAARRSPKRSARAKPAPRAAVKAAGRSGGKVDAPGKAHRKAPPRGRSVKHSDQTISKPAAARQTPRPRRG